jgi:peptidoglycan/LPS O-acetylase OafA/YrhL
LWYLEYLFLFTLVLLPIFMAFKSQRGQRMTELLARLSALPGAIFLWALPLALVLILLDPIGITRPELPEILVRLFMFPPFVVIGFLVFSDANIQQAIIRQRRVALVVAIVLTLASPLISNLLALNSSLLLFMLVMVLASLLIWSSILAVLGFGMRYLTASNRWLPYANEAVLPFYILHQPVILIVGYFIIPLPLSILAKYLIIASLAFGVTLGLYEFGIRRFDPLRRVFGLKARKQDLPASNLAAQPLS